MSVAERKAVEQAPLQPYRLTGEDVRRMVEAGVLDEAARVELIEGELIVMAPMGSRHAMCTSRVSQLLTLRALGVAILRPEAPLVLSPISELLPDLTLVRPREDFYADAHPTPADALLAIEVGLSSARFDRCRKAPLYARAGVPEVWLIDLNEDLVRVLRDPGPDADGASAYRTVLVRRRGEALDVQALPGVELTVEEALGPAE